MPLLTAEQALALAPDAASVKAGQGLASPRKWASLGQDDRSAWGECQGSGKDPYRTQVDLNGPAFLCSCPSRKFPCKHSLGLMLLLAADPSKAAPSIPPPWVAEWIAKRDANAEKKAAKAEGEPIDSETAAKREVDREKRATKREDRVRSGLAELQTWLGDLARQGLAHAKQQPAQFFDNMAARMIDAQAPGIARRLRDWPGIFASGDDWAGRALEAAGSLQWLIHGFSRLDSLPEGLRVSVRNAIGWTVSDQELATAESVRDRWQVLGQIVEEESNLRVQRTWLIGESTMRRALCLSFAAGGQPLDVSLVAGTIIDANLTFHPSSAPLRAIVRERHGEPRLLSSPATSSSFAEELTLAASLLAGDPWLDRVPWCVCACIPLRIDDAWFLADELGAMVPIARSFANPWPLFALSGGSPLAVFGEWDGHELLPLSAIAGNRFIALGGAIS